MLNKYNRYPTLLLVALLYISVFSSFIGSWLPSVFGLTSGGVLRDIVIVLFIFFAILKMLRFGKPMEYIALAFYVLFVLLVFLLVITSDNISASVLGGRNMILFLPFGLFVFFLINRNLIDTSFVRKNIFLVGFVAASLGVLDVLTDGLILNILGYDPNYTGSEYFKPVSSYLGFVRATGGISDALNFGYLMATLSFIVLFQMIYKNKSFWINVFYFILFILSFSAMVLSMTRGAFLVFFFGVFLILFFDLNFKNRIILLILSLLICVLFIQTEYGQAMIVRFFGNEQHSVSSSNYRIYMAMDSFKALFDNPLGIGLGTQGAGMKFLSEDTRVNTDNYFFYVMLEVGILGFILVFLMNLVQFYLVRKSSHRYMFLFMFFGYFICGALSSALISPVLSIFYWISINVFSQKNIYR